MTLIAPYILFPTAGGGGGTRRKLVSTATTAGTGMHSTSTITMAADDVTLAFWWRPTDNTGANYANTVFAGHAGQYQVYTGNTSAATAVNLQARMDGTNASTVTTGAALDTWCHVLIHFGQNHSSTTDVEVYINGSSEATVTGASASTEMTTAGTHYILGDDASGSATDDGCIGEIFDLCVFDGIIAVGDTNYNAGSWKDLSATGLAALKYRIDGQNEADPGEDSSGNGHDFTVESSGVTLSDTGLPTGANP